MSKHGVPREILLLVSSMSSGGAERVAAHLVNAWSARGDSVTLVVTFSGRGQCFYPLSDKVRLVYLADEAGGRVGRGMSTYWRRFWALRRLIRKSRPAAVVSFLTNVNIATLLVSAGLRRAVFVSERSHPPSRHTKWLVRVLRRITYRWASRVVMLTQQGLRWLESQVPSAKGVVIPNPVLLPLPRGEPLLPPERFIASERRLLLAVGRLDKVKQFDQLLESFATLSRRYLSWDLVILGEGPERLSLEQQAAALDIGLRVKLPGRAGNISDWYSRADLFVLTSLYEGFPNTLAEAMAHGCAAVSYDCDTGPRDIIRHEHDGLLVPAGDVEALTLALGRLMGDNAERQRVAAHATEVRDRYSVAKILAMWDGLFDATNPTVKSS